MNEIIKIEHKNQRVLTTQQVADCYETDSQTITNNFNRNKSRYIIGEDYFMLEGQELKEFLSTNQIDFSHNLNKLYLWSESGALNHAKSLGTDKAWETHKMLVRTYFRMKEQSKLNSSELSPQLQVLINMEIKQKEFEIKQKQLEDKQNIQDQHIQTIKDTIVNRDENWRKWVDDSIKKIGFARGNYSACYAEARNESYEMLKDRGHCNIETQLSHLKERLKEAGATQTKINLANKIDVIESDPKIKEIYTIIIKEMYIKYVA